MPSRLQSEAHTVGDTTALHPLAATGRAYNPRPDPRVSRPERFPVLAGHLQQILNTADAVAWCTAGSYDRYVLAPRGAGSGYEHLRRSASITTIVQSWRAYQTCLSHHQLTRRLGNAVYTIGCIERCR